MKHIIVHNKELTHVLGTESKILKIFQIPHHKLLLVLLTKMAKWPWNIIYFVYNVYNNVYNVYIIMYIMKPGKNITFVKNLTLESPKIFSLEFYISTKINYLTLT